MVKTGCVQEACAICSLHRKVSEQSSTCAGNRWRKTATSKIGRDRRYCARSVSWFLFLPSFRTWNTAAHRQSLCSSGAYLLIFLAAAAQVVVKFVWWDVITLSDATQAAASLFALHLCVVGKQNSVVQRVDIYPHYAAFLNAFQGVTVNNVTTGGFCPVHRRAEMLLRGFVVALSLLYLCDDPELEELEDVATINMQDGQELRRDGAQPHHKMAPVTQEVTHQPYRPGACSNDASVFKPEKGGDHDNLKGGQHFITNVSQETSRTVQAPMREDVSLSPNQLGRTGGSRCQKPHVASPKEQSPLSRLYISGSEKRPPAFVAVERDYLWCLWNTFSILSMIHIVGKYLGRAFQHPKPPVLVKHPACEVALPDSKTLQQFHSRCIRGLSGKRIWELAFLEGFANDLLEVMRSVCDRSGGMAIEGFQMDNVRNIIVPFTPPEPYRFQCFLLKDPLDMQVCGQIKLVETRSPSSCHCQSSDAEEVLCLLHLETKPRTRPDVCGSLSTKDSLLSKSQVTKWFQSTIKQAWEIISHRYQFEVNLGYVDTPGALRVRFRSGKVVNFTMNPVVKFNTDAYFFTSLTTSSSDTIWTLSLSSYEDHFFKQMTRYLPVNSCFNQTLEIALFLHRRQTVLTGGSELKDSHFKMALMHLLLIRDPSQWEPAHLEHRLRDLLDLVEKSLEKKMLRHVLVGNPLIRKVTEVPAEFIQADAVNLFHPLTIHNCLHRNAVKHFQEILRNARMLIDDYVHLCSGPEAQ